MKLLLSLLAFVISLGTSHPAAAADMEGQHFEDHVRLANTELQLNGLGMRAVLWLKGYVAGLYLVRKSRTAEEVYQTPGPKRIRMKMLLAVGAEDFRRALVNGIHANVPQAEWAGLQSRITQFEQAIALVGPVRKGDTITLDFVPERGLSLLLNDQVKGATIEGADFFNAVLAIFLGNAPVDAKLKRGLLGQPV